MLYYSPDLTIVKCVSLVYVFSTTTIHSTVKSSALLQEHNLCEVANQKGY